MPVELPTMRPFTSTFYDPETVDLLKNVLDGAWASLDAEDRAAMSKTVLAERILRLAANAIRCA